MMLRARGIPVLVRAGNEGPGLLQGLARSARPQLQDPLGEAGMPVIAHPATLRARVADRQGRHLAMWAPHRPERVRAATAAPSSSHAKDSGQIRALLPARILELKRVGRDAHSEQRGLIGCGGVTVAGLT